MPAQSEWEDRLFDDLPHPDIQGQSEYITVYRHIQDVVESANVGGDDPREMVYATLDEIEGVCSYVRETLMDIDVEIQLEEEDDASL